MIVVAHACQIAVEFTTADPGRKEEIVHEYCYLPHFDIRLMVSLRIYICERDWTSKQHR